MSNYLENLNQLKLAREALANAKKGKQELMDQLTSSDLYKIFDDSQRIAEASIEEWESKIKDEALADYEANKNKKPHEKVAIKMFKTFKIVDASKVRDWVFNNLPAALKVDDGMVKKYAVEFGAVEGTETGEEARVQIASEL